VNGKPGTVVRANDREMDVFIPDIVSEGAASGTLFQRHGGTQWQWTVLGTMTTARLAGASGDDA
jgi:hypothetical protein